jgi:hypothetical protein
MIFKLKFMKYNKPYLIIRFSCLELQIHANNVNRLLPTSLKTYHFSFTKTILLRLYIENKQMFINSPIINS